MIKINGFEKEFTLDLNCESKNEYIFNITSEGVDGTLPWGVELISNGIISATPIGNDSIKVSFELEKLKKDEFVLLRNYEGERIKIVLKPLCAITNPEVNKFKITKTSVEDGKIKIRILSKTDGDELGWKCTYDGNPLNYSVKPMSNSKSGYVTIELIDELFTDISSMFEFKQNITGNVARLFVTYNNGNITLKAD